MRWAEWNGRYRDDVRRLPGAATMPRRATLATRAGRVAATCMATTAASPFHSINFVTSHDGFTRSTISSATATKHNEANGEGDRDGDNDSFSDNYGVEGPTSRADVDAPAAAADPQHAGHVARRSQGVPMLLAGDECRRTQMAITTPTARTTPFHGSTGHSPTRTPISSASRGN